MHLLQHLVDQLVRLGDAVSTGQQVEVSISYVTDFAVSGIIGVQVDDVKLTNNGVSTPLTGFETGDLDGFTTPAAPEGSSTLRRTWIATGTIDLPGEEDRDGGYDEPRRGPPRGCDTSDQLPATDGDKVSEGFVDG